MNIDKIFNMFEPEVKPAPEDIVLVDFKDHPYYWVGMFRKIMLNYDLFSKKFISLFREDGSQVDMADIERAGEHFVYERAWEYISKLNIEIPLHLNTLLQFRDPVLVKNLNATLLHFQEIEEYEKCGFILKLIEELKKD
jgi:hypothetical protein